MPRAVEHAAVQVQAPLLRLEHRLLPYVGVRRGADLRAGQRGRGGQRRVDVGRRGRPRRLSLGIFFGLVLGKPVGVFIA